MWYSIPKEEVLRRLKTDEKKGLTSEEAKRKLKLYGENTIKRKKKRSAILIFLSQFSSPLVLLLIVSSIISLFLGEMRDTILIFAILIINAILGFYQEYKAEKSIEELSKYVSPKVIVLRDGKEIEIDSSMLVPGDIVFLKSGDIVPADIRILKSERLLVNESILTGESFPVEKEDCVLDEETPIYERKNMLFMGTVIERGFCKGVVVETGRRTELGKIAEKLEEIEEKKTPAQVEIEKLALFLTKIIAVIIVGTFILSYAFKLLPWFESLLLAVSLGVAAIPEGLPAVVTICFSLGARRMLRKNVLVRKLQAIQNLGCVDVICTDKTGTITEGKMEPKIIYTSFREYKVEEIKELDGNLRKIMEIARYCNEVIEIGGEKKGDQLEISLLEMSERFDVEEKNIVGVIPFDSRRKMMSVFTDKEILTKGAPEKIIDLCNRIMVDGKIKKITNEEKEMLKKKYIEYASKGYYVLGFAFGEGKEEKDLIFLGFVCFFDKIRERVKEAIEDCKKAGIRVIMVTGDNKYTALEVARRIGMKIEGVLEGKEIAKLSDEELRDVVEKVNIFARVTPEDKLRILKALQKNGHIVAMTGDGVNDCLALKKADVGVAVGRGAQVAKQVADIVILDNNFATIVDGIREGRTIMNNVGKFVNYLLSSNIGEVILVFLGIFFREVILKPIHLLWINLVTDGPIATSIAFDPPPKDIMERKPIRSVITENLKKRIYAMGIILGISLFMLSVIFLKLYKDFSIVVTAVFNAVVLSEFVRIISIRQADKTPFLQNKILIISLIVSIILQLLIIYHPKLSEFFSLKPLSLKHWAIEIIFIFILLALSLLLSSYFQGLEQKLRQYSKGILRK